MSLKRVKLVPSKKLRPEEIRQHSVGKRTDLRAKSEFDWINAKQFKFYINWDKKASLSMKWPLKEFALRNQISKF